jgi:hypothetical protein
LERCVVVGVVVGGCAEAGVVRGVCVPVVVAVFWRGCVVV